MKLYDAARCPFCARVRLALAEKGVPYETVAIDLADRPPLLYELNPLGKVPVLDSDRDAQSRLAEDLSDRLGVVVVALAVERGAVVRFRLYERGRMVDEYLSLPAFYGDLDRGDELALEANPTLVARLTGADRDEVRRVARTAASPADLPPPDELYREIARMMGLGVDR